MNSAQFTLIANLHIRFALVVYLFYFLNFWGARSDAFRDFLRICLEKDPDKRPSAEDLLKHQFVHPNPKTPAILTALIERSRAARRDRIPQSLSRTTRDVDEDEEEEDDEGDEHGEDVDVELSGVKTPGREDLEPGGGSSGAGTGVGANAMVGLGIGRDGEGSQASLVAKVPEGGAKVEAKEAKKP
ncbi:hypothetical protein BDK51DRAFT_47139, partial [Blyttiomyces helicus]